MASISPGGSGGWHRRGAADRTCGHGPDSVAAEPEPGPPRSAELRTLSCKRTIGEVFTIMEKMLTIPPIHLCDICVSFYNHGEDANHPTHPFV